MANNKLPFGLCEKYHIDLPEGATPRDAWEALKENGIEYFEEDESDVVDPALLLDGVEFDEPNHLTNYPTIPLPRKEYLKVNQAIAKKTAGKDITNKVIWVMSDNYKYMIEVHSFGIHRIIGKKKLK